MSKLLNRRKFVANGAFSTAGIMMSGIFFGFSSIERSELSAKQDLSQRSYDIMQEVLKYRNP